MIVQEASQDSMRIADAIREIDGTRLQQQLWTGEGSCSDHDRVRGDASQFVGGTVYILNTVHSAQCTIPDQFLRMCAESKFEVAETFQARDDAVEAVERMPRPAAREVRPVGNGRIPETAAIDLRRACNVPPGTGECAFTHQGFR